MYTTVPAALAHNDKGRSRLVSMALVASQIVLFFLFATPFYYGLYGVVNSLLIPGYMHNSLNSFDVNSLPLSDRKVLILFSV